MNPVCIHTPRAGDLQVVTEGSGQQITNRDTNSKSVLVTQLPDNLHKGTSVSSSGLEGQCLSSPGDLAGRDDYSSRTLLLSDMECHILQMRPKCSLDPLRHVDTMYTWIGTLSHNHFRLGLNCHPYHMCGFKSTSVVMSMVI